MWISETLFRIYGLRLASVLMHLVQALTLLPDANLTHWRLGYFLFLTVGLYFPLNFFSRQTIVDVLPQIAAVIL